MAWFLTNDKQCFILRQRLSKRQNRAARDNAYNLQHRTLQGLRNMGGCVRKLSVRHRKSPPSRFSSRSKKTASSTHSSKRDLARNSLRVLYTASLCKAMFVVSVNAMMAAMSQSSGLSPSSRSAWTADLMKACYVHPWTVSYPECLYLMAIISPRFIAPETLLCPLGVSTGCENCFR